MIWRRRKRGSATAGFTLIEILVAFTIAALFLGAFYEIFSTSVRGAAISETYDGAVMLAESTLDSLAQSSLVPQESSDRVGRYERRSSVQARADLMRPGLPIVPVEIRVRIAWREGVREREVALSTLRLSAAPAGGP
jgi:general secretion pathway protein I